MKSVVFVSRVGSVWSVWKVLWQCAGLRHLTFASPHATLLCHLRTSGVPIPVDPRLPLFSRGISSLSVRASVTLRAVPPLGFPVSALKDGIL